MGRVQLEGLLLKDCDSSVSSMAGKSGTAPAHTCAHRELLLWFGTVAPVEVLLYSAANKTAQIYLHILHLYRQSAVLDQLATTGSVQQESAALQLAVHAA
jgi:hypothetical protein